MDDLNSIHIRISGLNINMEKTKVVWFGSNKGNHVVLCPEYKLDWNTEIITVLGIKFSTDLKQIAYFKL